jgi:hypothetical protein
MKAPDFLKLISEINQLDHHQRSVLTTTALAHLSDEPMDVNTAQRAQLFAEF